MLDDYDVSQQTLVKFV